MTTHIGRDFVPPDVPGKVTGEIKYAEDYKREGMVFARLLTSPLPSGRVINIDASAALRMDGVVGILTADDLAPIAPPGNPSLASEYVTYVGQPILAVAATSEEIAESAIDAIRIDFERRDFVVDPLESLKPGGSNAYPEGNVLVRTREEGPDGAYFINAGGLLTDGPPPWSFFADSWSFFADSLSFFADSWSFVADSLSFFADS